MDRFTSYLATRRVMLTSTSFTGIIIAVATLPGLLFGFLVEGIQNTVHKITLSGSTWHLINTAVLAFDEVVVWFAEVAVGVVYREGIITSG